MRNNLLQHVEKLFGVDKVLTPSVVAPYAREGGTVARLPEQGRGLEGITSRAGQGAALLLVLLQDHAGGCSCL